MKITFLRGRADRPKEIAFNSLAADDDMWTHLMCNVVGPNDELTILYEGSNRRVKYADNIEVVWHPSLKHCPWGAGADIIFARGGFDYFDDYLNRFPKAAWVYYGAGKRYRPKGKRDRYAQILVDSAGQWKSLRDQGYGNVYVINKPAPPQFVPLDIPKKYDVGFVATIPENKRKRVQWVYKHLPPELSMLQLGHAPKHFKVPANVKVKQVSRAKMPHYLNQCRVVIAPYTGADSNPRIITEALACGVPVVASNEVNLPLELHVALGVVDNAFWNRVRLVLGSPVYGTRAMYDECCSMDYCASRVRQQMEKLCPTMTN